MSLHTMMLIICNLWTYRCTQGYRIPINTIMFMPGVWLLHAFLSGDLRESPLGRSVGLGRGARAARAELGRRAVPCEDDEKKIDGPVIGIDLGTTYSCVGIYKNGRVEIIPNDQGNRITPSYVAFTDDERLIGEAAKNQATINPAQTLFDVKRLIGRRFKDSTVQKDMKLLPFEIVDQNTKPMIRVKVKGEPKIMSPEEVSSMILTKMKETAENYLGKEVRALPTAKQLKSKLCVDDSCFCQTVHQSLASLAWFYQAFACDGRR